MVSCNTGGSGRRKRSWSRAVFSNLQRKGLEKRFQIQKYITKPDRRQLAATLGLTDPQVTYRLFDFITFLVQILNARVTLNFLCKLDHAKLTNVLYDLGESLVSKSENEMETHYRREGEK